MAAAASRMSGIRKVATKYSSEHNDVDMDVDTDPGEWVKGTMCVALQCLHNLHMRAHSEAAHFKVTPHTGICINSLRMGSSGREGNKDRREEASEQCYVEPRR